MKPELNNSFCYYPFTGMALKTWKNGKIQSPYPCCNSMHSKNVEWENKFNDISEFSLSGLFQSTPMTQLRNDILNDKKPEICKTCWKNEEQHGSSARLYSDHIVKQDIDYDKPTLQMLDIGTGNTCNLRCRMCSPYVSNSLQKDHKLFQERGIEYPEWGRYDVTNSNLTHSTQWQYITENVKNYSYIRASGGETLLSGAFIQFLDKCIEEDVAKHMTLNITTNATQFSSSMVDRLEQFKEIEPIFSIDGINKIYEYIRYPQKFFIIENNIEKFLKSNINHRGIKIVFVLTAYNIHNILDTIQWIRLISSKFEVFINFTIDIVHSFPFDISLLPKKILQSQYETVSSIPDEDDNVYLNIESALSHIKNCLEKDQDIKMRDRFIFLTKEFDINRNQSYKDYCHPELVEYLDSL